MIIKAEVLQSSNSDDGCHETARCVNEEERGRERRIQKGLVRILRNCGQVVQTGFFVSMVSGLFLSLKK